MRNAVSLEANVATVDGCRCCVNVNSLSYVKQLAWGRHIYYNFFMKQIKTRYQRSFLGFFWSLLNPALYMAIYNFVFSIIFRVQMEAFVIYLVASMLPFTLFSTSLITSSESLTANEYFLKRHYLPKMIFPFVCVTVALFDFLAAYLVLLGLGFFFGFSLGPAQLIVPLSIVILVAFTVGCSLICSVLGAHFADTKHILTVLTQFWFFATPIVYPESMVPEQYQFLIHFNPLYYLIGNFTMPLYYHTLPDLEHFVGSALGAVLMLGIGIYVFRKHEAHVIFRI